MKTLVLILLAATAAYAQKADTLKMSAQASQQYNTFLARQRELTEQFEKIESARFFFLQGFIDGKHQLTESDSLYFLAPDKIVITKKKAKAPASPPKK